MMKIMVVGASGTIGHAIVAELGARHTVIQVGRSHGEYQFDMSNVSTIHSLFDNVGPVDAVVCAAGSSHFGPLLEITPEQFSNGLQNKLMGQVNLVLIGQSYLNDGGSFTLVSGILSDVPIRFGATTSTVNAAVEGFARAAAIELPRGLRINVVSPGLVWESSERYTPYFRGFDTVPVSRVALAYSKSIEGAQTGQVYKVWI